MQDTEVQTTYRNFYGCSECGTKWTGEADCLCNDTCPKCTCRDRTVRLSWTYNPSIERKSNGRRNRNNPSSDGRRNQRRSGSRWTSNPNMERCGTPPNCPRTSRLSALLLRLWSCVAGRTVYEDRSCFSITHGCTSGSNPSDQDMDGSAGNSSVAPSAKGQIVLVANIVTNNSSGNLDRGGTYRGPLAD